MLDSIIGKNKAKDLTSYEGLPEPNKILIEEVLKVLYLNNIDPHKVKT